MIVCSCTVITDRDIETALIELLDQPDALIPTPGVVFRHLQEKMNCCGCAPLAIETIYTKMTTLMERGDICPEKGAEVRGKLLRMVPRQRVKDTPLGVESDLRLSCVG